VSEETRTNGSVVKPHWCDSAYQDRRYGKGLRVFTISRKKFSDGRPDKCTVCGKP